MTKSSIQFAWLLDKKYRIWFHVLFWIAMYLEELLSLFGFTEEYLVYYPILIELASDMLLVYFNLYILIPLFLKKNKFILYACFTLLSLIVNAMVTYNLYYEPYEDGTTWLTEFFIGTFLTTGTLLATAISFNIFKRYINSQERMKSLETSKLNTELNFLKDQINPHFLFNALNNIYVQSKTKPEDASETVLQLSDLLRYQLYECSKDKVYLKQEIEYIQNYLELNKIRNQNANITFDIIGNANGVMVAPLIFLPFVENAIKYGIDPEKGGDIKILLDTSKANNLLFKITNSKASLMQGTKEVGGIGLANVKRRLDLLYPNLHRLLIKNNEDVFDVELNMQL